MPKQENKTLKALQEKWYKILADNGFEDCEEDFRNSSEIYRKDTKYTHESKERYYDLIAEGSNLSRFRNRIEKLIMFRLSEGKNTTEISRELRDLKDERCSGYRQTIMFIIRRYEKAWGIRDWKPEQLKTKVWKKKKPLIP